MAPNNKGPLHREAMLYLRALQVRLAEHGYDGNFIKLTGTNRG